MAAISVERDKTFLDEVKQRADRKMHEALQSALSPETDETSESRTNVDVGPVSE